MRNSEQQEDFVRDALSRAFDQVSIPSIKQRRRWQVEHEQKIPGLFHGEGGYFVDYMHEEVDPSVFLLGKGWLEREHCAMVFGYSGVGKSSWAVQSAACWAVGREAFHIKPGTARKILIIQAEDTNNDNRRICKLGHRLGFNPEELLLLKQNLYIKHLNGPVGGEFFRYLYAYVEEFQPDLVIINPYTSYLEGDLYKSADNNRFLRGHLSKLLTHFKIGCIIMHHIAKYRRGKNDDEKSRLEESYAGSGLADLTNFARATITIRPIPDSGDMVYQFIFGKRWQELGVYEGSDLYSHSKEGTSIVWVPASIDQQFSAMPKGKRTDEFYLHYFKDGKVKTLDQLYDLVNKGKTRAEDKTGKDNLRGILKRLVANGLLKQKSLPNPFGGSYIGYHKSMTPGSVVGSL